MDNVQPSTYSYASRQNKRYVVIQVTLKEKLIGTGSRNLVDLEKIVNDQSYKGYRLHSFSSASGYSTGLAGTVAGLAFGSDAAGIVGGDRIQVTLIFERLDFAMQVTMGNFARVPIREVPRFNVVLKKMQLRK